MLCALDFSVWRNGRGQGAERECTMTEKKGSLPAEFTSAAMRTRTVDGKTSVARAQAEECARKIVDEIGARADKGHSSATFVDLSQCHAVFLEMQGPPWRFRIDFERIPATASIFYVDVPPSNNIHYHVHW